MRVAGHPKTVVAHAKVAHARTDGYFDKAKVICYHRGCAFPLSWVEVMVLTRGSTLDLSPSWDVVAP